MSATILLVEDNPLARRNMMLIFKTQWFSFWKRSAAMKLAARKLFGRDLEEGISLNSLVSDSPEKVLRSLRLWSSSRQLLSASVQINRGDGPVVLRCDARSR